PVADRSQLLEAPIGGAEDVLSLVQAILLDEGATERQLGGADLGEIVEPIAEQLERLARSGLGLLEATGLEIDLGKRAHDGGSLDVAALVEEDANRLLEVPHGLLGLAEQVGVGADVVEQPADGGAVGHLLVPGARLLRIGAREPEMPFPLG